MQPDDKAMALEALNLIARKTPVPRCEELDNNKRIREILAYFAQKELRGTP